MAECQAAWVLLDIPSDVWWWVESHVLLFGSTSVLTKAPVRELAVTWSKGACCNVWFSGVIIFFGLSHSSSCTSVWFKLCRCSEAAVVLGVLEWWPLAFVLITLDNVQKQTAPEEGTAVEYLQNGMQVFAEVEQKSGWVVGEDSAVESCFPGTSGSE